MNAKDVLRAAMETNLFVLNTYLSDLSDEELMRRPAPTANHLAWQLGHLINSEVALLNGVCPGRGAELPAGFGEQHSKDTAASDDPNAFRTRKEYQDLYQQVRTATLAALDSLPEADLDKPAPEWLRARFPTVGAVLLLIANHPLMHAGQFVVVRRQLDKPILI